MQSPIPVADLLQYDVSSEFWREYDFRDATGATWSYRIENPVTLFIKPKPGRTGSHRVVDAQGIAHYIPEDWKFLRWGTKPGAEPVQF